MWKLERHTSKQEEDYFKLVFDTIGKEIARIDKASKRKASSKDTPPIAIDNSIKKWFANKDNVRPLILASPEKMSKIEGCYKKIQKKYPMIAWNDIKRVLNYEGFIKKSDTSGLATKLAEIKNVRSCPYCNRAFTMLVLHQRNYIIRADFDHFLTKSEYPLFALSLYNLIPSCLNCNRTIKHAKEFEPSKYLHPYIDNPDRYNWKFDYRMLSVDNYLLEIDTSKCRDPRVNKTLTDLKLEEIYQKAHSDYELNDLIKLNNSYGNNYINDIVNIVMRDSGLNAKEVGLYLFGIEIEAKDDLNRVLNKMRRDILNRLKNTTS